MQTYVKPPSEFASWVIPTQILRGFILAVAPYPFLSRIPEMKRWGWLSVSSLYLLIGTIAGSGGAIEHIVWKYRLRYLANSIGFVDDMLSLVVTVEDKRETG